MKKFTQKFFLLSMGLMLSVGASAQTPTGAWNAFEDDGISHSNPTVLYKKGSDPNNPIYIIPAWDKRLYPHDNSNYGYLRARKITADGSKGAIVTAMGLLYDKNGVSGFNGQFTAPLQVWCEKTQEWLNVDAQLMNSLTYADLFEGGQSAVCVFKDSKNDDPDNPQIKDGKLVLVHQITETNHTIPTSVAWNGGGTGTITELGPCAYGNATLSSPTSNKYCRSAFKNLTIPNTITKIGKFAFRGIRSLLTVTFQKPEEIKEDSLTAIPDRCFEACHEVNTITLSRSIEKIGGAAFGGCGKLNRITFASDNAPTFGTCEGKNPFQKIVTNNDNDLPNLSAATCVFEVPLGKVNAYLASNEGYIATQKFPLCSKFPISTSSGVMTYCSDADFTFMQYNTSTKNFEAGDVKTYYIDPADVEIENGKVILTEVPENKMVSKWESVNEDFGVVLKGTSGTTYEIFYPNGRVITNKVSMENTNNCLHGVTTKTQVNALSDNTSSYFILKSGQFVRITQDGQCSPNRAYIKISGGPDTGGPGFDNTQNLTMTFPGDATGITSHEVQSTQNDAWYTLQGTQVNQPQKGIFIKNGKKIVIK